MNDCVQGGIADTLTLKNRIATCAKLQYGGGLRDANAYLPYYFYYDGKNGSILQPGDVTP